MAMLVLLCVLSSMFALVMALGAALKASGNEDDLELLKARQAAIEQRLGIKTFQNAPPREVIEMRSDWSVEKYR